MLLAHVRESKTVLDSWFHAVESGSRYLILDSFSVNLDSEIHWDYRFLDQYSGFHRPEFQIPQLKFSGFRIPPAKTSPIPFHGAIFTDYKFWLIIRLYRTTQLLLQIHNPTLLLQKSGVKADRSVSVDRIWHWDIFRDDKITLLGIVVDFVFNGVLQWNVRVTQLRITCFVVPTCYYHIITRTFVYFTPLQTLYTFSDCNALNIQFETCNRDVNIRMQSTVLVIVSILKKIKAYAVRINKEALKNLPSTLLPQRRKQYFVAEYSMVFAVHRHRIDHWRLTEAEKVAILSLSPKKHCPISSYFCIRVPW